MLRINNTRISAPEPEGLWLFAARRSPENHPGAKILAECLEAVRHPGGDKEAVTGGESLAVAVDAEHAGAAMDEIQLVLRVRLLRIAAEWRIQLYRHRSVRERPFEAFTVRPARASRAGYGAQAVAYRAFHRRLKHGSSA